MKGILFCFDICISVSKDLESKTMSQSNLRGLRPSQDDCVRAANVYVFVIV